MNQKSLNGPQKFPGLFKKWVPACLSLVETLPCQEQICSKTRQVSSVKGARRWGSKWESGNEIKIRPCIWLVILPKANMTASLIGLLLYYKMTVSVHSLCDTVKTCYEATNGEMTCELGLKVHFSTTLCWLWGKSPDLRQKVSFVKKYVFLESLVQRRSAMAELKTRGGRFCRSKVMQGDIFGWCSTQRGLLSLCPTLF